MISSLDIILSDSLFANSCISFALNSADFNIFSDSNLAVSANLFLASISIYLLFAVCSLY